MIKELIYGPQLIARYTSRDLLKCVEENDLSGVEIFQEFESDIISDITYSELVNLSQIPASECEQLPLDTYGRFYKIIDGKKHYYYVD